MVRDLKPEGFLCLANAVEMAAENPETFELPPTYMLASIKPGCFVKLCFLLPEETEAGSSGERMWVLVTRKEGDTYYGNLNNDPCTTSLIAIGDEVCFKDENVYNVIDKETADSWG